MGVGYLAWAWTVRGPLCTPAPRCLDNKYCIITGCNTGIGYLTACQMAEAGGTIIWACRNEAKATQAIEQMCSGCLEVDKSKQHFMELDLASLASVRKFADK